MTKTHATLLALLLQAVTLSAARRTPTPAPTLVPAPVLVSVTARLRELGGSDALAGVRASALSSNASAVSDAQGALLLLLPEGPARLRFESDDFAPLEKGVTVGAQGADMGVLYLRRVAFQSAVVRVRARRDEAPSRTPIKREEIRRIAGIGRDPLRALQTLPGVITPSDFSGQLAVRGGGPEDNLYLINGAPWLLPFHYGGAISTVHTDLLEGVDLYQAAFPARWAGVHGGVLDARSRTPRRDGTHGQVDINLLLSEALLEGGFADGKGGWLLSARRSYFDLILPSLGSVFTAVPRFWDVNLVVERDLGPADQVRLTVLSSDDVLGLEFKEKDVRSKDFTGDFRFRSYYGSAGLGWTHKQDAWRNSLTVYTNALHAEQRVGLYSIDLKPRTSGLREELKLQAGIHEATFSASLENQQAIAKGFIFRRRVPSAGVVRFSDPVNFSTTSYATRGTLGLQDRLRFTPDFGLTFGLAYAKADGMNTDAVDPRASLDWQAAEGTRLSAGWGLYSQFPSPQQLSPEFGFPGLDFNRSQHTVAGVEQRLGGPWSVKVEGYYKDYQKTVVEVPDDRIYSNEGQGLARGLELMLKHEAGGRFFGWLSYSFAESWRLDTPANGWRRFQYDQPHNLTLVGSYGLRPGWSIGARGNWHSGSLITPITGTVPDPDPNNLVGVLPVYGEPYSERLEDYVRLDLRTDYAFVFHGWKLNLYLEVINALSKSNPTGVTYSRDYSKQELVKGLPLLPYFGLGAEF
jgi:hypothetical protein